jgi:hypothetical protein
MAFRQAPCEPSDSSKDRAVPDLALTQGPRGLPKMPVSCPAQFGGSLRLVFAAGGRPFRPVSVQMSGCRVVSGVGPAQTVPSLGFRHTLGMDLGFKFPRGMGQPDGI